MRFYLGTHEPTWLNRSHVPLFVSAIRLRERCRRKLPRAAVPWALDSGGFSQLDAHGHYTTTPAQYAAEVQRWAAEVGSLDWAAVQDWMCEARVLARTGLDVAEHQRRTVRSFLDLRDVAPGLPWVPVVQGFTLADYLRCVDLYHAAGVDLAGLPVVGVGSVCRRQSGTEAAGIVRALAGLGLHLHGFGFKLDGIERCRGVLTSADSLAWSFAGRADERQARRNRQLRERMPDLFDVGPAPRATSSANDSGRAMDWLDGVQVVAGLKEEAGLMSPCPFCDSTEVHPPLGELDYSCANCGESWGAITAPALR